MLEGVRNGYELPDNVTYEDYVYVRNNKDTDPVLSGFVGFGCSFGGKWFGGYARNKDNTNYAEQSKRSLLRDMNGLRTTKFYCMNYKDVPIPEDAIVYCDPPYDDTTMYTTGKFNIDEFWGYVRELSKTNLVFVSELKAPDDFVSIWSKSFKRMLDVNKSNIFESKENLYIHKTQITNYISEVI